jgi:DNA-binding CsgD family transcriptional regulator
MVAARPALTWRFGRTLPNMSAFVGRADELGRLVAAGRTAIAGEVAAVLVVGEPGGGKSRLLAEAAKRILLGRQFRVVGYEPERQVPLAAAADLLRGLAGLGGAGRRLGELVFGGAGGTAAVEPVRILEAAHRAVAAAGPAVVFADDLQWVDGLSLALCHYLVRAGEASGAPLALIAAGRPSANEASLSASLAQILPAERLTRFELGPLASGEAVELVRSLAPGLGDAQAREVASLAGGSPFWVEALARTGGAAADAARLVTARLRGASADAGAVVAVLAVVARPIAVADLARLNGWPAGRAEHAAQELVARGLAIEATAVVRLTHDLVREGVARDIPEEQRAGIHGRVGEWLAGIAGEDVRRLREALAHLHAAGLPCLELAGRVVRSPRRTLLGEEGLALLAAVADQADPYDQTVLGLNQEIAAVASALGRHDLALDRSLVVADRGRDRAQRGRALAQAAKSAFALHDRQASRAYLERARETLTGNELFDLELDIHQAALDLWSDGRRHAGQALAHDAGRRARRLFQAGEGARGLYLEALRVEYESALQQDDLAAMLRAAEDRAAAARGFDEEAYLTASLDGAGALRRIGRLEEARHRARRVWEEAHRRVLPRLALESGYRLGTLLIESGRIAEAEDVILSAQELASRIGDEARGRHSLEKLASELNFYSGHWRAGISRLLGYAAGANQHGQVELHRLAALWLALAGGGELADEVSAELEAARAAADNAGCVRCATALKLSAADALAHAGRRAEAAESLAHWRRTQPHPQPHDSYVERRVEALLRDPVAAGLLEESAGEAEDLGFGLDALWTGLDLGAALAGIDSERATQVLTRVAQAAGDRGAVTVRELAKQRLRALGVRTWRRGSGGGMLTEREQVIARLIAAGASNPEIADRLYLSRKTVERHVSNVLRKAGVRNRAELAARVTGLEGEGAHR